MRRFHAALSRLFAAALPAGRLRSHKRRCTGGADRARLRSQSGAQVLEDRTLLTTIVWENRGGAVDTDGFQSVFGTGATAARNVVDVAIDLWEQTIVDMNNPLGPNTIFVNIAMLPFGADNTAITTVNADPTGLPASGTILIGRGTDLNGDPLGLGDGGRYFIDPTPLNSVEFNRVINAFVADATAGAAATQFDFLTVVAHELGHIVGINPNPLMRFNLPGNFHSDTGVPDNSFGGGIGTYWTFDGPTVDYLLTSNNGGSTGTGLPSPLHSAASGDLAFPISFDGKQWVGTLDIMNSTLFPGRRMIPSNAISLILQDAYGFDIVEPEQFGTFHALRDGTNGNLLIRGGITTTDLRVSSDTIRLSREGADLVVSVDLGIDVPGVVLGATNAFVSRFPFASISSITIQAGAGNDDVFLDLTGGDVIPTGGFLYNGGDGTDSLNVTGNTNFNLFSNGLQVTNFGLVTLDQVESAFVTGGASANTFTIGDWVGETRFFGAGGADTIVSSITAGNYVLSNTALSRGTLPFVGLTSFEQATLTGGADETFFGVSDWTGNATLNGGGGVNQVSAANNANFTLTSTTLARSTGGTITLQNINRVNLNGGTSANTFTISGWTGFAEFHGLGGNDIYRFTMNAAAGTYLVNDQGTSGTDELFVDGTTGADTLNVRRDAVLRGAQNLTYTGIERLQVNSAGSNDIVTVESTSTPLTVNSGDGNDTINVTYTMSVIIDPISGQSTTVFNIPSSVLIEGSTGTTDVLNVTFSTSLLTDVQLAATLLTGNLLGVGGLTYGAIERLNLTFGSSPDLLTILSTNATVTSTVNMGSGNDSVRLGGATVNNIRGPVTIDGGTNATGSADTLTLQELEPTGVVNAGVLGTPSVATAGTGFFTGFGMGARVDFRNIEQVSILEGPSNDTVSFQFVSPPLFALNMNLDGGTDGLVFLGTKRADRIQISRRVGADGPEVVAEINGQIFTAGYQGGETISVFAGRGHDFVTVDASVTTWRAELYGEEGNDHLVGGPLGDLLDGGEGHDWLEGGDGNDELIGGRGHDEFDGGIGDDWIRAIDGEIDTVFADILDSLLELDSRDLVV